MKATNKYHIVTYSYDSGEDSKQDTSTLKDAVRLAKEWLKDEYYHKVRIFSHSGIIREYIGTVNGRSMRTA